MEINKTKDADLMLLGNKELYNKLVTKNDKSVIIKKDLIKYKKEIKTKINELFSYYSDLSNNSSLVNNNEDNKYLNAFNLFIIHYIENIKVNNFKKEIQNELSIYNNNIFDNIKDNSLNSIIDFSNIQLDLNKHLFSKEKKQNNTLDDFVEKKNIKIKPKILPKKRNQKI